MFKNLMLLMLLLGVNLIHTIASDLPNSRKSGYYKYIYKLTPNEARSIYKNGLTKVDETYLHTITDSIPNDSVFNRKLPQGNYLLVWADKNELKFEMRSYSDIDVIIHNNFADLMLTVSDTLGMPVDDASVKLNDIPVKYDKSLKLYRHERLNKTGWLEVYYNGFTSYHYLGNEVKKIAKFKRIAYSVPIKYLYVPTRLVLFLPYHLVKTCVKGRPYGLLYYTYKPFKDTYLSIFSYGTYGYINKIEQLGENIFNKDYTGYMVFSKPKYRPKDTVRFKAYIHDYNGHPLKKQTLNAELNVYGRKIKLGEIHSTNKGSFSFEFVLHDSLNLYLDRSYKISLFKNKTNYVIGKQFKYEDYELNNITYSMRMDSKTHMKGKTMYAYLKGEDTNGLNVPDGRVKITVTSDKSYDKLMAIKEYLPDTIYTLSKSLDPVGETTIQIPDSIFPKLNFKYHVKAEFLTSDNERVEKNETLRYYYKYEDVDISFRNDSVYFKYKDLGKEKFIKAEVKGYDKNGNHILTKKFKLPQGIAVNYSISSYKVRANNRDWYFELNNHKPSLSIASQRTNRKVELQSVNPEGIWFNYFVYKANKEIIKGYTQKLDTIINISNTKGCYIALNYEWGGKSYNKSYEVPLYKNRLNVLLHQPDVIYPGQKANIEIEVRDYKNRPVKGVDLTSWGITKKFSYSPPVLSYPVEEYKQRTMFANYYSQGDTYFGQELSWQLNYNKWKTPMGLDTISFYQFTRPEKGIDTKYIDTKENITQFAPYVYKDGEYQKVHFIYVDYRLLYSSFSTNNDPYSFQHSAGFHKVRIRTADKDITVDSVYFRHGMKTFLSVDADKIGKGGYIKDAKNTLTRNEEKLLNTRFARFNTTNNYGLIYLKQGDRNYLLKSKNGYYGFSNSSVVGPLSNRDLKFVTHGKYSMDIDFEGSYEYFIEPYKVKMKTRYNFWGGTSLNNNGAEPLYNQFVISNDSILQLAKKREYNRIQSQVTYYNPYSTKKGNGTMNLEYAPKNDIVRLQNILVFKNDDPLFMRIYPAHASHIFDLETGGYRLFFSMDDGSYFQFKDALVKANGLNIYKIIEPDTLIKDKMSEEIALLIKEKWSAPFNPNEPSRKWKAEKKIQKTFNSAQLDYSDDRIITGIVEDDMGEPLPGVTVMLKGTTVGTITNFDGEYTLKVPKGSYEVVYSFIGFISVEIPLSYSDEINVSLEAEKLALEEVVVVGYGTLKKESVVGSITSVQSESLQGALPGVIIKGVSSQSSNNKPLIIIDGVPVKDDLESLDKSLIAEMSVLKEASATAIYGARGANGVILISTKGGKGIPGTTQVNDVDVPVQTSSLNTLRSNFSDEAFWKPNLVTNNKGIASFSAVFPDDITSWRTFALAKDRKNRAGQTEAEIKSFKPISAQLMVPRFLTQGDSVCLIGKSVNYLEDSIEIENKYEVDSTIVKQWTSTVGRINIDSLAYVAKDNDTATITYSLQRENGYFDGEKRDIPIVKRGLEEVKGEFFTLDSDTVLNIQLPEDCYDAELNLDSNPLNIILNETAHLRNYKHLCNEQAASKLIALLNEELICNYLDKPFKYKDDVKKLITRIEKSTNANRVWGWWSGLNTQWWITSHVIKALEKARFEGYEVSYDVEMAKYQMINRYETVGNWQKLNILETIASMNVDFDVSGLLSAVNDSLFSRMDSLKFAIIKQKLGKRVDVKPLLRNRQETLYGNYYWGEDSWYLHRGQIRESLLIYELLKNDGNYNDWLPKIRAFFYEKRGVSGWRNTYESALIINAILPDLFAKGKKGNDCSLFIWDGDEKLEVKEFPFKKKLSGNGNVKIQKTGDQVVFTGWHSRYFNNTPVIKDDYFEISSCFVKDGEEIDSLVAGQKVEMVVNIEVKKKSDYLMLEIPIPSVCSYASKPGRKYNEANREYYKEKTFVYYSSLQKGKYSVRLELVPRYTGKVFINPARMEHMYFPVFYGNNEIKTVKINSEK